MSEFIQLTCAATKERQIFLRKSSISSFVGAVSVKDGRFCDGGETLVYCGQAAYYVLETPDYLMDALE